MERTLVATRQEVIELTVFGPDDDQVYVAESDDSGGLNGAVESAESSTGEETREIVDYAELPGEPEAEAMMLEAATREVVLASLSGVPEFKTEWRKVKIGFVKVNVPYLMTRRARFQLVARLKSSKLTTNALWNAAVKCAMSAAASAGLVAGIGALVSGGASLAGFIASFKAALIACLKAKGGKLAAAATGLGVSLELVKHSGEWTNV